MRAGESLKVPPEVTPRGRTATLAAALDEAPTLLEQAVGVLRAWSPSRDLAAAGVDDAADLPIGLADRALLTLHEEALGMPLEFTVTCDHCGEPVTLPLGRAEVPEHHPRSVRTASGAEVREPTLRDLLATGTDPAALLLRCSTGEGGTLADLARVEGSLSGPLHADCVSCGAHLVLDVDVVALALRALGTVSAEFDLDVHVLASQYGWDLAVIESLPDHRRRRLASLARSGQ
ncbi:MAG TPA: hypothetical protein VFC82_03945 [Actinomycetaceae bacterium]|nr:hypothetical protein [Actinomycetaceae bacterium]